MTEKNQNNSKGYADLEVKPGVDRRKFLSLLGASMALAGATTTGCIRRPKEYIYPEVDHRPENTLPGVPKNYCTSALIGSGVLGLSVTSTDGRPTKIDGNYRHSMNNPIVGSVIGSSNSFAQAEILNLYEPERGQSCVLQGKVEPKEKILKQVKDLLQSAKVNSGSGVAFIYESSASPTFLNQLTQLQKNYPNAFFVQQDTSYSANRLDGLRLVADKNIDVVYNLSKASVILSVDSDFMGIEGDSVKLAREFADGRRVTDRNSKMNRLYSVESNLSTTGSVADHRYTLDSNLIPNFLIALYIELASVLPSFSNNLNINLKTPLSDAFAKWVKALAKDLAHSAGGGVVIVGDKQPSWVHALGLAINSALGSLKSGVVQVGPNASSLPFAKSMAEFAKVARSTPIQTIFVIGGNPVYSQPADINFENILAQSQNSVYLGLMTDETAQSCSYYIPQTHFLESWGDTLATDGTLSIRQPLIAPLYDSCVSEYEFLSALLDEKPYSGYEIVKNNINHMLSKFEGIGANFENNWRQYLSDGIVKDYPKYNALELSYKFELIKDHFLKYVPAPAPTASNLNIDFVLDRSVYDGRYANNSWLQELADPIYKLVWDNALLLSPKTARALGISGNPKPGTSKVDVIKVTYNKRTLEAAVWEVPGIADFTLVMPLGYGRRFGQVAHGAGFNANIIRTSDTWFGSNVVIEKTGETYSLVSSQEHSSMNGTPNIAQDRPPVVREAKLEEFRKNPNFVLDYELLPIEEQRSTLFKFPSNPTQVKWARQQWGMAIDLNTCIGCNACTIACQAENNISVVGKEEVFKNREMSWMRIDRYFNGNIDAPDVQTVYQPMNCQHCENAPCEAVCPVAATVHSPDGLNDMAYNRCVGTRYCANNCPYKVRRYNFFNYSKIDDERNPLYAMQKNPNVTVRFRGVMEKCTYCVHKINSAKIKANKNSFEGLVPDGEIVTACQSVCPTNSIVFGDVADPKTQVSKLKSLSRNYSLLGELNTKPRTTYLAKLRNINPEIG
jgi:Fe-S-cluster-containing dehydrogenase component